MSDTKSSSPKSIHELALYSREKLIIKGIKEIINFDENEVNVKTICGDMSIDGTNLHINTLDVSSGEIYIIGKVNGINYYDIADGEKKSLLSKIFR